MATPRKKPAAKGRQPAKGKTAGTKGRTGAARRKRPLLLRFAALFARGIGKAKRSAVAYAKHKRDGDRVPRCPACAAGRGAHNSDPDSCLHAMARRLQDDAEQQAREQAQTATESQNP